VILFGRSLLNAGYYAETLSLKPDVG